MKIIVIGDTHGREIWKNIIDVEENFDKIIFLGDYFDSKERINVQHQISNFKDIVAFKESYISKVILLFGNHDFHYLNGISDRYSGFQHSDRKEISKYINDAYRKSIFSMCDVESPYLFSHAGLTKTWCVNNLTLKDYSNFNSLMEEVNDLFFCFPLQFKFIHSENGSNTGDDIFQSSIWVRPESLFKDRLDFYTQIVGHTVQESIDIEKEVILIDTLGSSKEYLVIKNGSLFVKRLKNNYSRKKPC